MDTFTFLRDVPTDRLRKAYLEGQSWELTSILPSDAELRKLTAEHAVHFGKEHDRIPAQWVIQMRSDVAQALFERALDALSRIKTETEKLVDSAGLLMDTDMLSASMQSRRGQTIIDETTPFLNQPH